MKLIALLEKYKTLTTDSHIKWMCNEIIRMYVHEPWMDAKINRWLGFIQGFLFCNKMRTIHELREETRGIDDEG
jgi:hypothetical protein